MSSALPYDPDQLPRGERRGLLLRTPQGSRVLDVGCWSGFAGRFLAAERGALVDGIEPQPEMASRAAAAYRHVWPTTAEIGLAQAAESGASYDVILFLDVLEHLVDPSVVLSKAIELLATGGRVLVSLPNVAHWSVRKQLLMGRWEYEGCGLLDRTHLRFFTVATARQLLAQADLTVGWHSFSLGQPPVIRVRDKYLAPLRRWPNLFAVQILFDACLPAA